MRTGRWRGAALIVALACTVAACSHSSGGRGATGGVPTTRRRADVLVTIGSTATFGFGLDNPLSDSWPQVLFRESFPISTVLVNAADIGVTVDRATATQLALAREQHVTVAAVWLGDLDLEAGSPVASFESDLGSLVGALRAMGARVLVGNLSRARPGAAAYDDAIARVARARGATLVDLATALSATPGFGPSSDATPSTSRRIAQAFAEALAHP